MTYQGHGSAITCLSARECERELYTGSSDGTARSWDIETGHSLRVFDGHQSTITCMQVCLYEQTVCDMFCMYAGVFV